MKINDCHIDCTVLNDMLNSYDALSFITNKENEIIACNDMAVNFLKLYNPTHNAHNLISKKMNDVFIECGVDFEPERQLILNSLHKGKTVKILKETENYYHEISATPIKNSDMIILHIKDVTEHYLNQKEIQSKSDELEKIIDNMNRSFALHEMLFDANNKCVDYKFLSVNKAFYKSTGFKKDSIIGKTVKELLGNESKEWINLYSRIFENNQTLHIEKFMESIGKWYSIDAYRQNSKNFVTIFEDITPWKVRENQLTDIINSTLSASFLTDKEGTIIALNERGCNFFKLNKEQIIGKKMADLLPPNIAEHKRKKYLECIFTGEPTYFIDEFDGQYVENYVYPIFDDRNSLLYVAIHGKDITKEKQIEIELEKAKAKAEQSDYIKTLFLANMSHEIKTPMNAIVGFSDILLDPNYDSVHKERFLKSINNNAKHLEELLNNILDYAKIESGEMDLLYEKFSINDLFDELEDVFPYLNYKKNSESVKLIFERRSKDDKLSSDYIRLKQILYNLINNAINFTEQGHIRVGSRIKDNNIIFFVEDTGVGIPQNKLEIIFKRFVQLDDTSKKEHRGTGLGLSICKGLVQALGGEIWVDSKEGQGSTFFFSLPDINANHHLVTETKIEKDFSNFNIMIVDEVPENFSYLGILLKSLNINVSYANSHKEAVQLFSSLNKTLKLVFIDNNIIDILSLTEKFKQINKNIPIINISFSELEDLNIDYNISKPITKEKIVDFLTKLNDNDS